MHTPTREEVGSDKLPDPQQRILLSPIEEFFDPTFLRKCLAGTDDSDKGTKTCRALKIRQLVEEVKSAHASHRLATALNRYTLVIALATIVYAIVTLLQFFL